MDRETVGPEAVPAGGDPADLAGGSWAIGVSAGDLGAALG
jgi:hypothetical protein